MNSAQILPYLHHQRCWVGFPLERGLGGRADHVSIPNSFVTCQVISPTAELSQQELHPHDIRNGLQVSAEANPLAREEAEEIHLLKGPRSLCREHRTHSAATAKSLSGNSHLLKG